MTTTNAPDLTSANAARLSKALSALYRLPDGRVMSLKERIEDIAPDLRRIRYQTRADKKNRSGPGDSYPLLKNPKAHYTLKREGGEGINVPKIVFDLYENLPTEEAPRPPSPSKVEYERSRGNLSARGPRLW